MKRYFVLQFFTLAMIFFSVNSQAAIMEGGFSGTVWFYDSDYDDSAWSGYWDEDIAGTTASGSFWYDTEKAPGNSSSLPTSAQYRSLTNEWTDFNFTIGGKTFRFSDFYASLDVKSSLEMITIQDFTPATDASSLERFYLSKNMTTYSGAAQRAIRANIQIYDYTESLVDDLGLIQNIDWIDTGGPSYGRAYFSMLDYVGYEGIQALGWIEVNSFQLKEKSTASVPEPSMPGMLLSGFLILLMRRKFIKTEKLVPLRRIRPGA